MNDALHDANERVRTLSARVGRLEARERSLPRFAWARRRRLLARLEGRRLELHDAVAWQGLVETLTSSEG